MWLDSARHGTRPVVFYSRIALVFRDRHDGRSLVWRGGKNCSVGDETMQRDVELSEIWRLAKHVRETWEALRGTEFGKLRVVDKFPTGCCDAASCIVQKYLAEWGHENFVVMRGRPPESTKNHPQWLNRFPHCWTQRGELIIDITADQFPDIHVPVIVTRSSVWHAALQGTPYADNCDWTGCESCEDDGLAAVWNALQHRAGF